MSLLAVVFVVANLCSSTALAIRPVGSPTASLKTFRWDVGFDYAHGEIDFDIDWSTNFDVDLAALGLKKAKGKDCKSDAYLAKFGYGGSNYLEYFVFLGVADSRGKVEWSDGSSDSFDGSHDFSGGFGTKWTFSKDEQLSWGLVFQIGWSSGEDSYDLDLTGIDTLGIETIDAYFESFDIFLALGPTYEMEKCRIYGGPALYYYDADIDIDYMDITILEGEVDELMFGGYVGTEIDLDARTSLYGEYMLTDDAWTLGGGIAWRF